MRLYLVRHADPDYVNDTITPFGHKEAEALALFLKDEGVTQLFNSPLGRAVATMQYTANETGLKSETLPWLTELSDLNPDPTNTDRMLWDRELDEDNEKKLEYDGWKNDPLWSHLNVEEHLKAISSGFDEFMASRFGFVRGVLGYHFQQSNQEKLVFFTHFGFSLWFLSYLLGWDLAVTSRTVWLAPSSVTTILFEERSKDYVVPMLLNLGETSHLYKHDLPIRPRGIRNNFF